MNGQTHIYLRVSTNLQDADSQLIGITNYCEKNGIKSFKITKDQKSGALAWRERELLKILESSKSGDTIIVSEVSRIGRSTADVLDFLAKAAEKRVSITAVKNGITFDESISSKIFSTVLALASEIERDFIRVRTKEGMANARAKGKLIGRPIGSKSKSKLESKQSEMQNLFNAGVSKTAIARLMKVSRNTVIRFLKTLETSK